MNHLFFGMLLVLLDIQINAGRCTLGLLPDFAGYLLIAKGLAEMTAASGKFAKARPWAIGMAVYTGALYVMDLFAASFRLRLLSWCLGLAATAAGLVITYWIVTGILELEAALNRELQGQKLKFLWTCMAVVSSVCYLCSWIPVVGIIGGIGSILISICFLAAFYKTKTLYEKAMAGRPDY